MINIEEIRERCEAATPGPWRVDHCHPNVWIRHEGVGNPIAASHGNKAGLPDATFNNDEQAVADAEFIAHARTDIPTLLAEIDRLNAELSYCGQIMADNESLATQNEKLKTEIKDMIKQDKADLEELKTARFEAADKLREIIHNLSEELTQANARADAAVEDLKFLGRMDRGRLCEVCGRKTDIAAREKYCDNCDVFGIGSGHLEFEWRDIQEGAVGHERNGKDYS